MNETIYKYELEIIDKQTLQLPDNSTILSIGNQQGTLCLWALVNPQSPLVRRHIRIVGTGHPLSTLNLTYLGTVVMNLFVGHVFEDES